MPTLSQHFLLVKSANLADRSGTATHTHMQNTHRTRTCVARRERSSAYVNKKFASSEHNSDQPNKEHTGVRSGFDKSIMTNTSIMLLEKMAFEDNYKSMSSLSIYWRNLFIANSNIDFTETALRLSCLGIKPRAVY